MDVERKSKDSSTSLTADKVIPCMEVVAVAMRETKVEVWSWTNVERRRAREDDVEGGRGREGSRGGKRTL
jgi:hypothetical protein